MQALISKDGTVKRVHVMEGDSLLRSAADGGYLQMAVQTVLLNGRPVEVATTVTVDFKPRSSRTDWGINAPEFVEYPGVRLSVIFSVVTLAAGKVWSRRPPWLADRCGVRVHSVGVVEVVVRVDVGFVEHGAGGAGDAGSVDDDLGGHRLVEMRVHHGEGDLLAIPCGRDRRPSRLGRRESCTASSDPR